MFFPCTQQECDKLFNCKKALKEHERTHNQDRPFKWYLDPLLLKIIIIASCATRLLHSIHLYRSTLEFTTRNSPINATVRDVITHFLK